MTGICKRDFQTDRIDMRENPCIIQTRAEPENPALPICNYSYILYRFLEFTQNLKQSQFIMVQHLAPQQTVILASQLINQECPKVRFIQTLG